MRRLLGNRRGQALVMVTLGLIAMCGLMGLAVDLGWSYFVKKQAQASADAGALAAAEEAMRRLGGVTGGFTCSGTPSGTADVYCQPAAVGCGSLGSADSNLWNGCLYSKENGFEDGGLSNRQTVTIASNEGVPPGTAGLNNIRYWVTTRASQTVPQLFSAVLGNPESTVTATATAGIVAVIVPGSFYGLNREGDCIATGNTRAGLDEYCGVDVRIQGSGGNSAPPCPGSGGVNGTICAADGIALSSTCHGDATQTGCSDPSSGGGSGKGGGGGSSSGNYAGTTGGSASVWANNAEIRSSATDTGAVNDPTAWTPTPSPSSDESRFRDPFEGKSQPPLIESNALGLCGIRDGIITGSNDANAPQEIGPYLYYSFSTVNGVNVANTNRIRTTGHVSFNGNAPCTNANPSPGATLHIPGAAQNSLFPMYMFYGGLEVGGDSIHFGAGQYVMVGTNQAGGGGAAGTAASLYFPSGNRDVTGDTDAGTMFITTAPTPNGNQGTYAGLQTQLTNLYQARPELNGAPLDQGHIEVKAGASNSIQLNGVNLDSLNMPQDVKNMFADHENVLLWQDRRNSSVRFNSDGTILDRPCAAPSTACVGTVPTSLRNNGVTEYSPEFIFDAAVQLQLNGVIYQPRGAWFSYQGNADISASLRVITGMINMQGGGQLSLLPTAAPIIKYVVALVH